MPNLPFQAAVVYFLQKRLKQNYWKSLSEFIFDVSLMLYSFLGTEMLTINNLLFKAEIDNINLFKVINKTIMQNSGCHLLWRFFIHIIVTEILWEEPDQQKGMWLGLSKCWLLHEIIVPPLLQLGGFVEKYAGTGMTLHPQSCSNKENRRTQGLNHYLQTLQSNRTAPGRTVSW